MFKVLMRSREVFGNTLSATKWLLTQNRALGNKVPLTLVFNKSTKEDVLNILSRIEHGVYT